MFKFLLCENPMKPGRVFIIHTPEPACLIEAICLNDIEGNPEYVGKLDEIFDLFSYKNTDGVIERWELLIVKYFDVSPNENESTTVEYRHVIKRAWKWYLSYLQWEDKNIDQDNENTYFGTLN